MSEHAHSLFHAAGTARCKTSWSDMQGDDMVRVCSSCGGTAYRFETGTEEELLQRLLVHEDVPAGNLRLYRRGDGTFTTNNRLCNIPFAESINAWLWSVRHVGRVLTASPFLALLLIAMTLIDAILKGAPGLLRTSSHSFATASGICILGGLVAWLITQILVVSLGCRITRACWTDYSGTSWRPQRSDLSQLLPAVTFSLMYGAGSSLGLWLAVVPGVYLAFKGSLGMAITNIEELGPIDTWRRSFALTTGSRHDQISLLLPPLLIMWLVSLVYGALGIVPTILFKDDSAYIPFFICIMAAQMMLANLMMLTFFPLQTRLYKRLRDRSVNSLEAKPEGKRS